MSSLNITDLYGKINERNLKRYEKFDDVLKKIHIRIKYNASLEKTFCFYQIPEFIIGVPLYNITDLRNYLINSLKKDGFQLIYVEPNWLFITWEIHPKKMTNSKDVKKEKNQKKKSNFKLTDEYKPSGKFIYNEQDLLSMEQNMKHFM